MCLIALWIYLCTYLHHAAESDGGHTVLLRPMDWWGSTLHILLFKWMTTLPFQEVWPGGIFLWCVLHAPVWTGRYNVFSGCNSNDFSCVNPTAICSCCTFVSDMTLVSPSETAFQAKFPQVSQVQFASFFPLLLTCKWLSRKCGIGCEYLFKAPMALITNHSLSSVFLGLYPNWKTALLGESPGIAMTRTSY